MQYSVILASDSLLPSCSSSDSVRMQCHRLITYPEVLEELDVSWCSKLTLELAQPILSRLTRLRCARLARSSLCITDTVAIVAGYWGIYSGCAGNGLLACQPSHIEDC